MYSKLATHSSVKGFHDSHAKTFFPNKCIELAGDIHFNDDETFTHNSLHGTNLAWTALHEIGHSLGLDHSHSYGAVMSPYYTSFYHPDLTDLALSTDDIRGIQALYGNNKFHFISRQTLD
ncbi:MAG: matrixin family metalloprotease, partial [Cyanobacteria bacterium J06649_11]